VGLGGAGGRRGVEHVAEHGRVLGAVGAVAELAGDIDRADGADGLDPVVARGRVERVAAGGADAQRADPLGVGLRRVVRNETAALMSSMRCAGSSRLRGMPPLSPW